METQIGSNKKPRHFAPGLPEIVYRASDNSRNAYNLPVVHF